MYLYESLFKNDSIFLNHNSEKTFLDSNLRLIWEVIINYMKIYKKYFDGDA